MAEPHESRWSLNYTGNRVMWAVIAGFLTWLLTATPVAALLVGVVLFALLTAITQRR